MLLQTLAHYRVVRSLGKGGMGEVYLADDTRLKRSVALKILPAGSEDPSLAQRFVREARAASSLTHPNIAHIYDVGEESGVRYIAMEYVDGQPLTELVRHGPLEAPRILDVGIQIADALDEAHAKGVVHRDIKPQNILITPRGQVKVLDFGLAKLSRTGQVTEDDTTDLKTESGLVMGTVHFMSPEQALGRDTDCRTDVFSIGVVLYVLATGRLPFSGASTTATIDRIVHAEPEAIARFNYSVPAALESIVRKCLEKDRERRYQTARELLVDLRNLQRDVSSAASAPPEPPRAATERRLLTAWWIVVAAVAAGLLGWTLLSPRYRLPDGAAAPARIDAIAVLPLTTIAILPFVNASGNPDMEYLGDGITESLINSLSQVPNLAVMSRNAVFRYKGREIDAQAAGQTLKVRAVLTGRVVLRGDGLSISAELIDVRNNHHLWGEQYNRELTDILAVQEEISTEISGRLRFKLTGEEKKRLTKRYTQSTEAYQLYLRGRYHWNKKTPEGFNKGIEYFQKAIEADPNYAPAYAGLAALYNNLANYNFALVPPREAWEKAKAAAGKALQIDDNLAAAHASLALVAFQWEWDWPNAEKEFKRSLELDPSSSSTYEPSPSSTYHWYSHYLMTMGRTQESLRAGRRALELDPLDLANNAHQGWHYLFTRQYDRAIERLQETIEMDPNFPVGQWYLGLAYEQKGAFQDAIAQFENCVRITGGRPSMTALLGHAHAAANRRSEAQAILQQLSGLSKQRYVPSYPIAAIHAALGQKDEAFAWLEKAYDERDSWMDYLGLDPRLDGLRSDPRFSDLLRRMNLVQ